MAARVVVFAAAIALAVCPITPASANPISVCTPGEGPVVVDPQQCVHISVGDDGSVSIGTRIQDTKYQLARDAEGNVTFCRRESSGEEECLP